MDENQYRTMSKQGLMLSLDLPLAPGEYWLRLAVGDNDTGYRGTLDLPATLAKSK